LKTYREDLTNSRVYAYLSSVRLTILLCIGLALASIIGTVIPQNASYEHYLSHYGDRLTGILRSLGVFDLYHSVWFIGLLVLLALNLVVCTARKFPPVWRQVHRETQPVTQSGLQKWRHTATFLFKGDSVVIQEASKNTLDRVLGKPIHMIRDGTMLCCAQKGRYARYGPYLTHASILVILIGSLVGSIFGFRGSVIIPEGGRIDAVELTRSGASRPLGFTVQCTRFVMAQYPDGTPKDYRSELAIFDHQDTRVVDAVVRVNHPLTYRGLVFYQSTYGSDAELTLSLHNSKNGKVSKIRTKTDIPFVISEEDGDRAMVMDFEPDFQMPPEMAQAMPSPKRGLGPAAQIVILRNKGVQDVFWIFKGFPDFNNNRGDIYSFTIEGYTACPYTGLQVVKDPGSPVVWLGCILMVVGFILSFFFDHEIVWVALRMDKEGETGTITLAGRAVRHPASYDSRFARVQKTFKEELAPFLSSTN